MRSHNFARTVIRIAARSTTFNLSRQVTPSLTGSSGLRSFSVSSITLKKKKFSTIEEVESIQDQDFDIEQDDLFGSVSSSPSSSPSTTTSAMTRVEFAQELEQFESFLSWQSLDSGKFPSLHRFRFLAGHATTQNELESLLSLAKMYRDRVGSLGEESAYRFVSRASAIGFPEVGLNGFMDRYNTGLEFNQEGLYLIQRALAKKLARRNREEILNSVEIDGAPVQNQDLFGVLPSEGTEGEKGAEGGEGKAEAIQKKHELDMPFARAQLSIIDRMSLLSSLSPSNPILLSFIPRAYIGSFNLVSKRQTSNPLLSKIYSRTDKLISLLTITAKENLTGNLQGLPNKRSDQLAKHFTSILTYVAMRGQKRFKEPVGGKQLDPVRVLYRYMDKVGQKKSQDELLKKVEPLFQHS